MVMTAVACGLVGIGIGLIFRTPALIACTLGLAVLNVGVGIMERRPIGAVLGSTIGLSCVLQVSYLVGLVLPAVLRSKRLRRLKSSRTK